MTDQDPQARVAEVEGERDAAISDVRTLQAVVECGLGVEHIEAVAGAGNTEQKVQLAERLRAGQPTAAIAAAPVASRAPSQARPARDGRGRFSPAPGGFGGGVAPSGRPFSGTPDGQHPADAAIRAVAENPRASA